MTLFSRRPIDAIRPFLLKFVASMSSEAVVLVVLGGEGESCVGAERCRRERDVGRHETWVVPASMTARAVVGVLTGRQPRAVRADAPGRGDVAPRGSQGFKLSERLKGSAKEAADAGKVRRVAPKTSVVTTVKPASPDRRCAMSGAYMQDRTASQRYRRIVGPRSGALGRNRTCDTRFRKPVLYPLSYEGDEGAASNSATTTCALLAWRQQSKRSRTVGSDAVGDRSQVDRADG